MTCRVVTGADMRLLIWRSGIGSYRFAKGDLISCVGSGSDGGRGELTHHAGVQPEKSTGNGGAEQLRWPEKRALDAEVPETWGRLGETQRVAANSRVVSVLAGKARINGAARTEVTRATASSGGKRALVLLHHCTRER